MQTIHKNENYLFRGIPVLKDPSCGYLHYCMKTLFLFIMLVSVAPLANGQPELNYYLPEGITYRPSIPTPPSVIGHEVGEWHVTHDRLVTYMMALAKASDRVHLEITGYTYEGRPLLLLIITSPKNHQRLEEIRQKHLQLSDPSRTAKPDVKGMPIVFYMGFSIHGNEASGVNAGLLAAYHFAAAQGDEIERYLDNTIMLFDPCYNPDGMQRFSSWVNSRKSMSVATDPNDAEHNEAWPGGRFNHYWFDLNRDWLVAQHPESRARVRTFQQWRPNVLTDHHEMGTNATFFFQPGVPSRTHPLTPERNMELTRQIGTYHAKALDKIGSLYFTQESYDDFYYGKGSTFPDIQGAVGILFEQASSRGHAQESVNGVVTFPFTIRNQFVTALSTLTAINEMRVQLLDYQHQFYRDALAEANRDPVKAYVFGSLKDAARAAHLAEVFTRQSIDVYRPSASLTFNGKVFEPASSYIVPLHQRQYRLIKSMFEKRTTFRDSLFYDISSWTLPLAFDTDYEELKSVPALGDKVVEPKIPTGQRVGGKSTYAYVFQTTGYYAPRAIYRLLRKGIRVKVASDPFFRSEGTPFDRGSILIPVSGQEKHTELIETVINEITAKDGIDVYAFNTGLDYRGVSLGSSSFLPIKKPVIAMLVGDGISPTDAGEIWHLLDTRYNIPVTLLPVNLLDRASLERYTTIIAPAGNVHLAENTKEKLKDWIQQGGVVIGFEDALTWLQNAGLGKFEMRKGADNSTGKSLPYADIEASAGAQNTSGVIFEAQGDLTHPLLYGFSNPRLYMFKSNNLFMEPASGAYSNPVVYSANPLISGYISKENYALSKRASVAGVTAVGPGRVIGFTDNLCLRAFWLGTNKMLMNAIYYGPLINAAAGR